MFARLTEGAREAVTTALEEVRGLGHERVGAEHLLLGVMRVPGRGRAAAAASGLAEGPVRALILERLGTRPAGEAGYVPFAPEAQAALEAATAGPSTPADTGDLLLALLDAEPVVAVLARCGAAREQIERRLADLPRDRDTAPGQPDPREHAEPIAVYLGEHLPLGDLGNVRTDARLLLAIVLRGGPAAEWLAAQGIDEAALREHFGRLDLGFE